MKLGEIPAGDGDDVTRIKMEADGGRCSVCPPCCHGIIRVLRTRLLLTLNAAGIVLAFVIAFSLREARLSQDAIMWIGAYMGHFPCTFQGKHDTM